MAITVGKLAVGLVADTSKFSKGMRGAGKTIGRVVKRMAQFGAAGAAAIVGGTALIVRSQLKLIDTLGKTAQKLGLTTAALAELQLAAGLAGIETTALDKGLTQMVRRISEAATGTGEAVDTLKDLGLNVQALNRLSPDEQFRQIADAMAEVTNQADRVRFAYELFGGRGVELIRILDRGSAGLEETAKRARELGIALNDVDVTRVEAANDAMLELRALVTGIAKRFTSQLAPVLKTVVDLMTDMVEQTGDWKTITRNVVEGIVDALVIVLNVYEAIEKQINRVIVLSKAAGAAFKGEFDQIKFILLELNELYDQGETRAERFLKRLNENRREAQRDAGTRPNGTPIPIMPEIIDPTDLEPAGEAAAQAFVDTIERELPRVGEFREVKLSRLAAFAGGRSALGRSQQMTAEVLELIRKAVRALENPEPVAIKWSA